MKSLIIVLYLFVGAGLATGQMQPEKFDSAAIAQICDEGMNRSHACA